MRTVSEIKAEIVKVTAIEVLVATNDGTFGGHEAVRCVGTAEPQFCVYRRYETVGGQVRETGPSADDAPGRIRQFSEELAEHRQRLAELRAELKSAR